MKAVRIFDCGDTGVLAYGDYPMPEVGASDLLVRVLATSVSRWDVLYRAGTWRKTQEYPGRRMFALPMQLGRDAVGVVEAVGAGGGNSRSATASPACRIRRIRTVRSPSAASAICPPASAIPAIPCSAATPNTSRGPEHYWMHLPDRVAPETAAAAMWSYSTSHRILTDRLAAAQRRHPGHRDVRRHGFGTRRSCPIMGVRVIGVTRSPEKVAFLRAIGCDDVMVGAGDDTLETIGKITGGAGVDGAVEFTGNQALAKLCIAAMRPGGTLVTAGADWSGERFPILDQDFVRLELTIRGIRGSKLDDQRAVLDLLRRGLIKPAVFAVMPLSAIAKAHELLERSDVTGRIVLDPWRDA